jgi:hypothetical protein
MDKLRLKCRRRQPREQPGEYIEGNGGAFAETPAAIANSLRGERIL